MDKDDSNWKTDTTDTGPYKRYCRNCGEEIKSNPINHPIGQDDGSENTGTIPNISPENTPFKCSMCGQGFCSSCLTHQIDENTEKDYYFCHSCLKVYHQKLKEGLISKTVGLQSIFGIDDDGIRVKKKKRNVKLFIAKLMIFLILTPILTVLLSGAIITYSIPDIDSVLSDEDISSSGIVEMKRQGEPVVLVDNASAQNCTWYELLVFLDNDDTDELLYQNDTFVCTAFAERLHNNAEQAGIRAAYVSIEFYEEERGHALNAFETTDEGFVFIDCTGSLDKNEKDSYDKVAYVEIGQKLGVITLDYAKNPEYDFYVQRKEEGYYIDFLEMGIVEDVDIYWSL